MDKIVIGIPSTGMYNFASWGKFLNDCLGNKNTKYETVEIHYNPRRKEFKKPSSKLQFILFDGGADVSPELYGQVPHPRTSIYPYRDSVELFIFRHYLYTPVKYVGICRGHQFLNVMAGGILIQDLASIEKGHKQYHEVILEKNSILFNDYVKNEKMTVNSYHHQAVKVPGIGLRVTMTAINGVIEGTESAKGDKIRSVQPHPESGQDREFIYSTDTLKYLFRVSP